MPERKALLNNPLQLATMAVSNDQLRMRFHDSNLGCIPLRKTPPCKSVSHQTRSLAHHIARFRTSSDLGFSVGWILGFTLPEVGEPDGLKPCCRWYILGVSIAGGAPRLPGATATLVMVISRDGRRPQCLRSTSSPRPSVPRAILHPQVVANL